MTILLMIICFWMDNFFREEIVLQMKAMKCLDKLEGVDETNV